MGGLRSGQVIGSVFGGVIGGIIGGFPGAMLGASLGGMVGGWLDPPSAPSPPPLGDVGINSYVHNAPIPLVYGQNKVYGGVIWIGNMGTRMKSGGSKKSPTNSAQMWIEFAVGHCEGPVVEYLKYWMNDKEISELSEEGITFTVRSYLGTDSQTTDPSIESFLSGSEASAVPFKWTAYSYVYAFWDGSYFNNVPSFSAEIKALLTEIGEEDANPIKVLYDFLTNSRYGANINTSWFDGDPDTVGSSWKIAADYCDELVSYEDESGVTIQEPRFRFSHVYDSRTKGYDIVKDILQSCRGIFTWSQGQLYVHIENGEEEVSGYFTDEYTIGFVSTGSSTVNRIYFNTSIEEPEGFWEGGYLQIIIDSITYSEMINTQGSNYVDLVDDLNIDLGEVSLSGVNVYLTKDNIKESSFSYKKTSSKEKYNSIRIEFINRKWVDSANNNQVSNQYLWDVVEIDQPESTIPDYFYGSSYLMPELSQQQIRLNGIKRKSQAMRMAKWYADFNSYISYYCEFSTDMVGYLHKVGDIIGITHSSIGWEGKEFRIVSMEEIDNDEIKFACLEYNRSIYGDITLPVFTSSTSTVPSLYTASSDIERFHIARDLTENRIYVNFKRPENDNWWVGGQVWLKRGLYGEYTRTAQFSKTVSSVKLSSSINDSQTIIGFDSSTLYGSFPTSGSFWIEDELISYTGISNNQFTGCTRGSNASSHISSEYCHLKETDNAYVVFDSSDIGTTLYFKVISVNIVGVVSSFEDAVELSIELT